MRSRRSVYARRAVAVAVVLVAATSAATVTQVDGTIVPVINDTNECDGNGSDDLQTCFNTLEGVAPPAATAINAVVDAAQFPEVFVPNTTINVTFRDISEGAGFENSFGWYNVGDDVLTPAGRLANLHPVLGCGVPMMAAGNATTHAGNPAFYVQDAEPGDVASVNFASEQAAGRYKGGFIGFYLITPEGNEYTDDCGDFKDFTDGRDMFGRIYFTQRDLNNDGDFVHHLVYSSKVVANRFYFGFEDLFRGGDNDFEDMAIQTVGLAPPCVPQAEICDGQDNDCDGLIDAADPDLTGDEVACLCDGVGITCQGGPRQGDCRAGQTQCVSGSLVCVSTTNPTAETCNLEDDNCDGTVDNGIANGAACDGPDGDLCNEGFFQCVNGSTQCSDTTGTNIEICNGLDEDCDTRIDEGVADMGSCGTGTGECNPGTLRCVMGGFQCVGQTTGTPETCNGLDDDCNGVIDNMPSDVGASCGVTGTGECSLGQTVCLNGSLQCAGELGPTPERCNMLDDDCDGNIDEMVVDDGQPCGTGTGECEPGVTQCVMGMLACTGGQGPVPETCDGLNNDCDASVDEEVPTVGDMCGTGGMGSCSAGSIQCISGMLECVGGTSGGTETCNAADDDCDGDIDEGDLCNGGICQNGTCASRCIPGEFPCPPGTKCEGTPPNDYCVTDPCANTPCPNDADGNAQTCVDQGGAGVCVSLCSTLPPCTNGTVCRGTDGICVPDTCQYLPEKCADNELCVDMQCVVDPCIGVTCEANQFCREGACIGSCQGVQCPANQECRDGTCEATGCDEACASPQICNPTTGDCQASMCNGTVVCGPGMVCDPLTGDCISDPCTGVECPAGQMCNGGQCGDTREGELVTTGGGGGGCNAAGSDEPPYGAALALMIIFGLRAVRRRQFVELAASAALATALGASGCSVNEYCIGEGCKIAGGDGGSDDGDGGTDDGDGGTTDDGGIPVCDPATARPEVCNNIDDDCDDLIDEGIKDTDELNCGTCGNQCNKPGAVTQCQTGSCVITGCFPGFNDADDDIDDYTTSNGCEYMCFQSNGGVEACDTLDNDCDNLFDEGIDVSTDVANCGMCGRECDFFAADETCSNGMCSFDPATDCDPGFIDANGMQADGCEYQCTPTGAETCDVRDNDCDGRVDEGFDLNLDEQNCGRCGNVCNIPNANETCTAGVCGFNPATDCAPGFHDADGNPLNGCEYSCTVTNGGTESCDGVDNDCDGVADDAATGVGVACAATTPPRGACVANGMTVCSGGTLICANATQPTAEVCDTIDQDCDGTVNDGVTQGCYTGTAGTSGVGLCRPGTQTCGTNGMFGTCMGQVTPVAEACNNQDDNCDGRIDNRDAAGNPLQQTCYSGPGGTAGVGICRSGTRTCAFGSFGTCAGEVLPTTEVCGDNANTDCDANDDAAEGCLALAAELRIDSGNAGQFHTYDVVLARGGSPLGRTVYAAYSELNGGNTDIIVRKSTDGGLTWPAANTVNITSAVANAAVKPVLAVTAGAASDTVVVAYQTVNASDERDIAVAVSQDSAATFPANRNRQNLDAAGDSFKHAVALSGTSNIVITWEKLDTTTLNRDIQTRSSTNGGDTYTTEVKVNTSTGTRFAGRPTVVFSGTRVVWAWREQRAGATRDIFAASAATLTDAPTGELRIDGAGAPASDFRDSDFPVMLANGANVFLVWQDTSTQANGGSDVVFARSVNGGAAWSAEAIIDDPAGEVSSSFTPSMAIDAATNLVTIAWEDRRQGTQVFTRTSTNNGAAFGTAVRATSTNAGPVAGTTSLPVVAAAGSGVIVVAYQNQLTNERPHVFTASSIDSGATWTVNVTQLDGGAGPALAPAITASQPGMDFAATIGWTDFRTAPNINGDIYVRVNR